MAFSRGVLCAPLLSYKMCNPMHRCWKSFQNWMFGAKISLEGHLPGFWGPFLRRKGGAVFALLSALRHAPPAPSSRARCHLLSGPWPSDFAAPAPLWAVQLIVVPNNDDYRWTQQAAPDAGHRAKQPRRSGGCGGARDGQHEPHGRQPERNLPRLFSVEKTSDHPNTPPPAYTTPISQRQNKKSPSRIPRRGSIHLPGANL